jgi:hypothetical protein
MTTTTDEAQPAENRHTARAVPASIVKTGPTDRRDVKGRDRHVGTIRVLHFRRQWPKMSRSPALVRYTLAIGAIRRQVGVHVSVLPLWFLSRNVTGRSGATIVAPSDDGHAQQPHIPDV